MRATRLRLLALCAAVLALLPGCKALTEFLSNAFKKPELTFRNASLADIALSGLTLNLNYDLHNPNAIGLSLAEVDYALFVEDKQVVAGKPPQGLNIPPSGTTNLTFPANIKFQDIAPVADVFLNKDRARYRAEGHLGVQTPIGILKFPIQYSGEFEVPKVPAVAFQSPRVSNLSLNGATIDFPLTVTNRNSYDLPINGITGNITVAGANVGSVSTGDMGVLGGRATKQLSLPLNVNLLSIASAANVLRGGGTANVGFAGSVRSGQAAIPLNFSQNLSFQR